MTKNDKLFLFISLGIVFFAFLVCIISLFVFKVLPNLAPEQHGQVRVVGKRIRTAYIETEYGMEDRKYPQYLISFEFLDGVEKEFEIPGNLKISLEIYDSIQEGDTGMLSYKESKNAKTYEKRRFINFKKYS